MHVFKRIIAYAQLQWFALFSAVFALKVLTTLIIDIKYNTKKNIYSPKYFILFDYYNHKYSER